MRRIAASAVIWLVLVGGAGLYMNTRPGADARADAPQAEEAAGYAVEMTTTFEAKPDPFALSLSDTEAPAALRLKLNGATLFERNDNVGAGERMIIDPVPGVRPGANELFIEAYPPAETSDRSHAVRVRVLHDGIVVLDATRWSEPGSPLAAPVEFEAQAAEADAHGH